ncbi:hypothetical protein PQX77_016067 [Marasmius sp. AFHP31]|nr:hypothetical protein PQX77_016067 [Marasmius sp. AFHP31]
MPQQSSSSKASTPEPYPNGPRGSGIVARRASNKVELKQYLHSLRMLLGIREPPHPSSVTMLDSGIFTGQTDNVYGHTHPKFGFLGCTYYVTINQQGKRNLMFKDDTIPRHHLNNDPELRRLLDRRELLRIHPRAASTATRRAKWAAPVSNHPPRTRKSASSASKNLAGTSTNRYTTAPLNSQTPARPILDLEPIYVISDDEEDILPSSDDPIPSSDDLLLANDATLAGKVEDDDSKGKLLYDDGNTAADRLEATENEINFRVVVFRWSKNNEAPKSVQVPILKSDTSFISLQSIKFFLGNISIEIGNAVERYVASEKTWKQIQWSTPFRVSKETVIGLKLSGVRDMKDWKDYRTHTFD